MKRYIFITVLAFFAMALAVGGVEHSTMTFPTAFLVCSLASAVGLFGMHKLGVFKN